MPLVNIWCAHTTPLMPTMPIKPPTAHLYPNNGLPEKCVTISNMSPKPGKIIT